MPFKKRHLCAEIALILSSGLLLTAITSTAQAQLPQISCRANDAGDGWICEQNSTSGTSNTILTTTSPLDNPGSRTSSNNSASQDRPDILLEAPDRPAKASQQADEPAASSQAPDDDEPTALTAINTTQRYDLDWVPLEFLSAEQLTLLDATAAARL